MIISFLMPTYPYKCQSCGEDSEVVKKMRDASREEVCSKCSIVLTRVWTSFQIMGAKVEYAEFNPGLGCVVKNSRERNEIAKRHGLIEVGNETPETIYRETVVNREKEREKEWDRL